MPSVVGLAFVVDMVLIIFGINASASLGSRLSALFTSAPSDRTIWLLVAGVAAAILGLGMRLVGGAGHSKGASAVRMISGRQMRL